MARLRNLLCRAYRFNCALIIIVLWVCILYADETIKIATWNIEHLGSPGRGLGGIGAGNLSPRSEEQIKNIARLIKNNLKVDLLALQEVAITDTIQGLKISAPLEVILNELGDEWSYFIGSPGSGEIDLQSIHNMQNAFMWNASKVRLVSAFDFEFPNQYVGLKRLYDRLPLFGYFQVLKDGEDTNDFLLVNVHLASGQNNDENHLVAIVIIEQNLYTTLKAWNIKESDRIILGDFNDNPFAVEADGDPKYTKFLYNYMEYKNYKNLVTENVGATRMDDNLESNIDKILVNSNVTLDLKSEAVTKYLPPDASEQGLAAWRQTYSDHFPLIIELKVRNSDNDVD